ncbi:tRNA (adenine(22)-N(1))-methyltransferase [Mesoplasma tabanidae]|uniref:tRNA (Adenine22-N1)-methyltransferase n=1 Tax=Mesoplasma tabanidae TaxID=219745 RepID=A0A2K8P463_9MOLU|nr:class I SAM-dependent methyltransferase [Mesoplasma tabanidae]ATZ21486.1 tRNA (adenine22-N1)-methyltransferase [Mesoplasma tabanidae]
MLTKRLRTIADLIDCCNVVADIGTDHAYLPITLVKEKRTKFAYAVDVNKEPLSWAKKNIKQYNYNEKIQTILSNGLDFVFSENIEKIDVVSICGLGSTTILEIIKKDNEKIDKYIICSNTEISSIRNWVLNKNYSISFEDYIVDSQKGYWVVVIEKNHNNLVNKKDILFGNKTFFQNNKQINTYYENEIKKYEKILSKIDEVKHYDSYNDIKNRIAEIRGYLNEIIKIN